MIQCPHCSSPLTEAEIRSLWGALANSKRKTLGGNPNGRPRKAPSGGRNGGRKAVVQPHSEPSVSEVNKA